ncbi:glycosyltransferase family 1 protein [Mesobacillus subterraneus]|uniref:Glycosyl transferase family 1 n=1 Tax=Mesobacillus subterraneus TaxID=285983 RepID=A0A0D6Z7B8_9BACI|nr:glycosyltransferase family 1 protein [Mesobacillus subterraneus]KIY21674.1 glycosyl transferase family 1 [Mesobacillus subterraneus]
MKPIRVLQVVTVMNRGGLETMLMNYYRRIDRSKIQFDFMVHREEKGHYDEEITEMGGKIIKMPKIKPGNYQIYFNKLEAFFQTHREYKVVHSHINENSSFVLRAAKRNGVPCRIAHSHLSDLKLDMKFPFRLYARASMKDHPNKYFACSKNAGKWLFSERVANTNELVVLNNAVNAEEFKYNAETRKKIREELAIKNELVIGHIGRFTKQKNHDFLLDIFKAVSNLDQDAILLLAGDGPLRRKIENKVTLLGLQAKVKFLGVRSDINSLMHAMDIFVFPSLFEGLPVVLVEAQAAGLNCIVADTITSESDITGRVEFLSLKEAPETWAREILSSSYEHADTEELISVNGYNTATMSKWLTDFYIEYYEEAK